MKTETKFNIQKLQHSSTASLNLDSPKNEQSTHGLTFRIAGWAYAPHDAPMKIAIERKGTVFITDRDVIRSDVRSHLNKVGSATKIDSAHGFNFEFIGGGEVRLGFCLEGNVYWSHKISEVPQVHFSEAKNLKELFQMPEGTYENFYFHNSGDWSKIVFLFNGALTPAKVRVEGAIFQRWSWAKKFKHPVICIADPLTIGEDGLILAWYLGDKGRNLLPRILDLVISEIRNISPHARLIGIGSSGGGFAAIGGALTGRLDEAIAMNPQTDAMLFEVKTAVSAFSDARDYLSCDSDLKMYDFSQLKDGSTITYLQNLHDNHHKEVHYKPFRSIVEHTSYLDHFRFIEYEDAAAGHNPPNFDHMQQLIGNRFFELLK